MPLLHKRKNAFLKCEKNREYDSRTLDMTQSNTVLHNMLKAEHFSRAYYQGGSVAEWLACRTQAQKGPGSNRSRDVVR